MRHGEPVLVANRLNTHADAYAEMSPDLGSIPAASTICMYPKPIPRLHLQTSHFPHIVFVC